MRYLLSVILVLALATPVWGVDDYNSLPKWNPNRPHYTDNKNPGPIWDWMQRWPQLVQQFKTSLTEYGMSDYAAGEQSISFQPTPPSNPITFGTVGLAAAMVLATATTANVGAELDPDFEKHQQERRNLIALMQYLHSEFLKVACSASGGTPVIMKGGNVNCVPAAPPPPPPQPIPCPYGKAPDGTCYNQPQEKPDKSHGGGQGRPNNDNSTDPWDDQDCWQEGGKWFCL